MSEVTLKPCPFCGGEADEHRDPGPTGELYVWVGCNDCDATSACVDERSMQPEESDAQSLWNTRAEASSAEPVAWMYRRGDIIHVFACRKGIINGIPGECWTETPLYAHPPAAPDTVTLDRALVEDDFAPIWDDSILLTEHKAVHASVAVGGWLSAALDDPNVCDAMKADVNRWFSAGFLYLDEVRKIMQAHRIASDLAGYERGQRETVARIVAWLRNRKEMTERYIDYVETAQAADAIEAGEWK